MARCREKDAASDDTEAHQQQPESTNTQQFAHSLKPRIAQQEGINAKIIELSALLHILHILRDAL
jgi:hypothetical protein